MQRIHDRTHFSHFLDLSTPYFLFLNSCLQLNPPMAFSVSLALLVLLFGFFLVTLSKYSST